MDRSGWTIGSEDSEGVRDGLDVRLLAWSIVLIWKPGAVVCFCAVSLCIPSDLVTSGGYMPLASLMMSTPHVYDRHARFSKQLL